MVDTRENVCGEAQREKSIGRSVEKIARTNKKEASVPFMVCLEDRLLPFVEYQRRVKGTRCREMVKRKGDVER